ncbi:sensor histidine kinase [Knoellia sp. CPCC 206453]|uniref:sensor histidine kinase n=1 Tax=Knoellia pratensis TaxID=3404796 RepID=UPI00361DA972
MTRSWEGDGPLPWVGMVVTVGVAALCAAALLPTGLSAVADGGLDAGWRWGLAALLVALHLTLVPPLVTQWPVVALAIGSASMLGLVVAPDLGGTLAAESGGAVPPVFLPSGLVWFVLLYAVSARTVAPWPSIGLATGLVGSVLVLVRLWDSSASEALQGPLGWRLLLGGSLLAGTVAAWALGRYRATRQAWTAALSDRAAAQERRRIAREMHDVVAHSLAVVVAQAEGGRMLAATQPERAPEILDGIASQGREALGQMRGLLGVLREAGDGSVADGSGAEAPQPTLADLPTLVAQVRATGHQVELETFGDPRRVDPGTALTAYRVVQESLTNVVKHAGRGATARVSVDWTNGLTLTVSDDGTGAPAPAAGVGRGLIGMHERIELVGGTLAVGPQTDGGWQTCARIPA